jgi:hypothetical protein
VSFAFLNEAGGLRYHLRGLRYAENLWQPFRFALAEWLYAWEPPEKKLVVVGPSGGWCVQPFFFERFSEVLCLEPDPVALRFERGDHLIAEPERLVRLLEQEGDACVLFTNVLGQLLALLGAESGDDPRLVAIRAAVGRAIRGRSWASFHDRVSGTVEPSLEQGTASAARLSNAELVHRFYPALEQTRASEGGSELLDHLTAGFFPPERPHAYFTWPLMPGVFHLIEATSERKSSPAPSG